MKKLLAAILYTGLAFGANTAVADMGDIAALRSGDMKKLILHESPRAAGTAAFTLQDAGGQATLADYQGKYVLLNFWATWCAPCRKEMPMLSALQSEFGGDRFEVLTVATGRNSPQGIKKFFEETGIDNLPRHQDPKQALARQMAVMGLPITVILDPEGNEIGRLIGDADWASDSARAIIATLVGPQS